MLQRPTPGETTGCYGEVAKGLRRVVTLVASGLPAWRASRVDALKELKQGGGQRPL